MNDTLESILVAKRKTVNEAKSRVSIGELERDIRNAAKPRDFRAAVDVPGRIGVIAEMKRRSPSAGEIRPDFDPAAIARAYEAGGAAALSVLTEADRFGGSLDDLMRAKEACNLPVLRKDFVFDAYQIAEARVWGADAVLLIAEMLTPRQLAELASAARHYGVEPLVEIFSEESLPGAVAAGSHLIGINTRNLRTLDMEPENVFRLSPQIPGDRRIVAESGIKKPSEIQALARFNVSAVLVGESLLRQADLQNAVAELAAAGQRVGT